MKRIHIGRKAPSGWMELPGAIHLGRGIWMMWIQKEEAEARMRELEKRVKDLPPEFEDVIAKRFWDLFDAGGPRP